MGRPPCCDKVGIKKGPWTPEEDIILVSYIQEHGPGNWRSVPINTGLLRCSKSCRLRWTNYLRPGIKRGNFTPHEEGMIIRLQALLGNKWAAIASYLPQRTDNDIKNYWNTHLKKSLKKFQTVLDSSIISSSSIPQLHSEGWNGTSSPSTFRSCSTYASSTENISKLLEGWMRDSPKPNITLKKAQEEEQQSNEKKNAFAAENSQCHQPKAEEVCDLISNEELEQLFTFENLSKMAWEKVSTNSTSQGSSLTDSLNSVAETKENSENRPPYSFHEKWILDEATAQVEDLMDLSLDCSSGSIF
ncbi:hypothetical protein MRB53_001617 [Persea americana]|uniref:Uncharacterized protein n=1 Tax=Persea americana TaxID=3435 RepID=A0ACC2MSE3_PERAE|nr:hypothetical protein MRB53_001617 [Persea americana]